MSEAQRRSVVVLMADITGYSEIAEVMEVDWLYEVLNDILAQLSQCILRYGGVIDKYVGDEIVALFGFPSVVDDAADRAVQAAISMLERMEDLNGQNRELVGKSLDLHVGINSGVVIAGRVGLGGASSHTIIGDAVNVAKRLQTEAAPGQIYISASVKQRLRGRFDLDPLGTISVRGRRMPIETYLVASVILPRSRTVSASDERWVPRDSQVAALRAAAEPGHDGAGPRAALIVGEVGVGKSAIARRFLLDMQQAGRAVVEVRCTSITSEMPYWALGELMIALSEDPDALLPGTGDVGQPESHLPEEDRVGREAVAGVVAMRRRSLSARRALDLGVVVRATKELLRKLTGPGPLVVSFDEAHWIDDASAGVLSAVASDPTLIPFVFWVLVDRSGDEVALAAEWAPATIAVPPLTGAQSAELIAQSPGTEAWTASLQRSVIRESGGNPLCLTELIGWLQGRTEASPAAVDTGAAPFLSMHSMVLSRVEALQPPLPLLLQACAVVGEPVLPALVYYLVPDDARSPAHLAELVRAGYLAATAQPGEFALVHRMAAEVVYDTIPAPRRRELHGRLAQYLVDRQGDRGNVHLLARHAFLAGWGETCLPHLIESATAYRDACAYRDCLRVVERALEVMSSAPDPSIWHEDRARLLLAMAQSLQGLGEVEDAATALAEASALADEVGKPDLQAAVNLSVATSALMRGACEDAVLAYELAALAWEDIGEPPRVAQCKLGIGMVRLAGGELETALEYFQAAARLAQGTEWMLSAALNAIGVVQVQLGCYEEARANLLKAAEINEAEGDVRGLAHCYCSLGELHLAKQDLHEAARWFEAATIKARVVEDPMCICRANALLVRCYASLGDGAGVERAAGELATYHEAVGDGETLELVEAAARLVDQAREPTSQSGAGVR